MHCLVTHSTDSEQFDRCRERRKRLSARGGESVSPSDSHRWLSAKLCFGWLAVGLPTDSTGSNKKKSQTILPTVSLSTPMDGDITLEIM